MNTLDFLNQSYVWLRRHGLTTTKAEFSTSMLGKAPSYLTSMSARHRHPPLQVISHMRAVLQRRAVAFRGNPHFAQPYAKALNLAHERVQEISNMASAYEAAAGRGDVAGVHVINSQLMHGNTPAQTDVFAWLKSAISRRSPPRSD